MTAADTTSSFRVFATCPPWPPRTSGITTRLSSNPLNPSATFGSSHRLIFTSDQPSVPAHDGCAIPQFPARTESHQVSTSSGWRATYRSPLPRMIAVSARNSATSATANWTKRLVKPNHTTGHSTRLTASSSSVMTSWRLQKPQHFFQSGVSNQSAARAPPWPQASSVACQAGAGF